MLGVSVQILEICVPNSSVIITLVAQYHCGPYVIIVDIEQPMQQ